MHPAGILGHIDGTNLIGEGLHHRGHEKADHRRYQQRQDHIDDQLIFQYHGILRQRAKKPIFL